MASPDLDLQEKELLTVKNILHLKSTEARVFRELCGLDGALAKMRQQLHDLMLEEFHKDYAVDVEKLRREVELIYHEKLGQERRL